MKSKSQIRRQIKTFEKLMKDIPEDVKADEKKEWDYFCKGGISALYWALEEENPATARYEHRELLKRFVDSLPFREG